MKPRNTVALLCVALLLGSFVYFYQIRGGEERRAAELESQRIFQGIEASDVDAIWLYSGHAVTRANRSDGEWQLVSPIEFPGDDTVLEGIASAFAQMTPESQIEAPQEPSVYGLGPGAPVIYFSALGVDHGLRMGNKAPIGANHYVSRVSDEENQPVYTIASWRVNAIQKDLDSIRDKRILDFDRTQVEALELSWPDGGVELRKGADSWRVQKPIDDVADQATIDRLLSDLAFMRAEGFDDEPQPDSHTGLDAPGFKAVIHLQAAEEDSDAPARTLTIELGSFANGPTRFVRGRHPSLYKVAAGRIDDLPRELFAYRQKLLSEFAIEEAQRLELSFRDEAGERVRVEVDKSDKGWSGGDPAISPEYADRLVTHLARLEAIGVVADKLGDAELAGLGLDPPNVSLQIFSAEDEAGFPKLLSEVHLGVFEASTGITARPADSRKAYRLDWNLAEFLPVSLEAYRARFLQAEVPDDNVDAETVEALPSSVD